MIRKIENIGSLYSQILSLWTHISLFNTQTPALRLPSHLRKSLVLRSQFTVADTSLPKFLFFWHKHLDFISDFS